MEINAEIRTYKTAGLKKWLPYIGLFLIIVVGYRLLKTDKSANEQMFTTVQTDSIIIADTSNKNLIDSLKDFTVAAVQQIRKYEQLKKEYENQEAEIIIQKVVDSSALISLRAKLSSANNEIARLNGELVSAKSKRYEPPVRDAYVTMIQPAIETPDENSIVINIDGRSKRGNIPTDNLTIYLIPYSNEVKHMKGYDSSCNSVVATEAKYYNGLYFFNSVQPGKYLIKVCTYMGDWKLIKKDRGKQNITMQVSPPIQ